MADNDNQTNPPAASPPEKKSPWWALILLILMGGLCVWVGYDEFIKISEWEEKGGTRYFNSKIKLIYDLTGKWGVLIFLEAAALVMLGLGAYGIAKKVSDPEA